MIVKRILRGAKTSNAGALVRYMLAAKGGVNPQSWERTADYILDVNHSTTQGEKVASFRVTNCATDDPADATSLILLTQSLNTTSKSDKTYHMVFSFREGEHPSEDVLHQVEDELCNAIGLGEHQRISAVHINTENVHVHVAINKVHPTGHQNVEPFYDKQRLMEACERLEVQFGLEHDDHGLTGEQSNDRTKDEKSGYIKLGPEQHRDSKFREYLRKSYALAVAEEPEAKPAHDLRKLSWRNLAHRAKGYKVLLPGYARHRVGKERPEHSDSLRRPVNGHRPDAGAGINHKILEIEKQSGVETLTSYVAKNVGDKMRAAQSWSEIHDALREHGLEIKPHGAGFVIGDAELGLWTKASAVGRDLAKAALEGRIGPYQAPAGQEKKPGKSRYQPRPIQAHPLSKKLYGEYVNQRQAAMAKRKLGMAKIKAARISELAKVRQWSVMQRSLSQVGRGKGKAGWSSLRRSQVATARQNISEQAAALRQALYKSTCLPSWNDWLIARAEQGDTDALAVLRAREKRSVKLRGDLLTAGQTDKAAIRILQRLKPQARADGTMVYRTVDGGVVSDRSSHVKADKATIGATFVALNLAAERFSGQTLNVQGTEQFRADVARLAGVHRIKVAFSDPEMERIRQKSIPVETQKSTNKQAEIINPAVQKWIDDRNSSREKISSIHYNRIWTANDAGRAEYAGRRKVSDGSEVVLLKKNKEILVKPVSSRVAAKASRWQVGQTVNLDKRGRFISQAKSIEL